jgi:hypothetical protein
MLVTSLGAMICEAIGVLHSKLPPSRDEWIALAALAALALFSIVTWPPTVLAAPEGLHWRRLLIRRLIPWDQIEAAYTEGPEGDVGGYGLGLYILVKGGKRYVLNELITGRAQLKALIKKKLTEIRGSKAIVR